MTSLTSEQQAAVELWAREGATLNDVQRRLKEEFSVNLTYLDARMLLIDLQVKLQDKPKEKEPVAPEPVPPSEAGPDGMAIDEATGAPVAGSSTVKVIIDELAIPGAMVSGKVTFSDGQTAGWYLDQAGRLGLRGTDPGYKPPAADVPVFQAELDRVLMQAGY